MDFNASPSTNGPNGRDSAGRFLPGHPGGPGNPFARRVAELRSALLSAVSAEDLRDIIAAMIGAAKNGDVAAAKLVFERVLGQPEAADLLQQVAELEARVGGEQCDFATTN